MKKKVKIISIICLLSGFLAYCFTVHSYKIKGSIFVETRGMFSSYYGDGYSQRAIIEPQKEDITGYLILDIQVSSGRYWLQLLDDGNSVVYESVVEEGEWLQERVFLGELTSTQYELTGIMYAEADEKPGITANIDFMSNAYGWHIIKNFIGTTCKEMVDFLGVSNYKSR